MQVYECDGCGACCKTFPIFAAAGDAEREPRIRDEGRRLPPALATARWTYQLYPLPFHEACCFLDGENRCTVYATRPEVCRTFAAGGAQCQEARARVGLPRLEPGKPCHFPAGRYDSREIPGESSSTG